MPPLPPAVVRASPSIGPSLPNCIASPLAKSRTSWRATESHPPLVRRVSPHDAPFSGIESRPYRRRSPSAPSPMRRSRGPTAADGRSLVAGTNARRPCCARRRPARTSRTRRPKTARPSRSARHARPEASATMRRAGTIATGRRRRNKAYCFGSEALTVSMATEVDVPCERVNPRSTGRPPSQDRNRHVASLARIRSHPSPPPEVPPASPQRPRPA